MVLLATTGEPRAEIRGVSFPVRGMVCPLCTRGVEASIKTLPGVATVQADLASGRVEVVAQDGRTLSITDLRERAAKAGFPVNGQTDVLARGRFSLAEDGRMTFRPIGGTQSWQVLEGYALLALFRANPTLRGDFLVGFRLNEKPSAARPSISIMTWEKAPPAAGRAPGS